MILDNNNNSHFHLLIISSVYSFQYSSLLITAPKCLCPDDVILMLVLSNISEAFNSYLVSVINIVLLGFGKYSHFGPIFKRSFHQLHSFNNLSAQVKSSIKTTILVSLLG